MKLSINNMRKREEYLKELIQEKEDALKEVPEGFLKSAIAMVSHSIN